MAKNSKSQTAKQTLINFMAIIVAAVGLAPVIEVADNVY